MDEVVADPVLAVMLGVGAAMHSPAAAGWDPPEFLDVHVDELAGPLGVDAANHVPGRPIHPRKSVESVAAPHAMHRRGRHPHDARDAGRAQVARLMQPNDAALPSRADLRRTPVRSAQAILQPVFAFGEPTSPQLIRGPSEAQFIRGPTHVTNLATYNT
jgi:hypothetical protein